MASLSDRLTELMTTMGWRQTDLVRVSRQSSSVVSQWLGHGSKEIKTIGKLEAALYLERATGYSALWIAKGDGPKRAELALRPLVAREPTGATYWTPEITLQHMGALLELVPPAARTAFADILRGWVLDGGGEERVGALLALLRSEKRASAA
jgi:hypothetical protein